jgi:hypothetical protein
MSLRAVPLGFVAPCLPTIAPHPPSGGVWRIEAVVLCVIDARSGIGRAPIFAQILEGALERSRICSRKAATDDDGHDKISCFKSGIFAALNNPSHALPSAGFWEDEPRLYSVKSLILLASPAGLEPATP